MSGLGSDAGGDGRRLIGNDRRLAALRDYAILDTAAEPVFDDVVSIAAALCEAPIALVSLVERERQWFKAKTGLALTQTPIEQSVCSCGLGSDQLLIIPDLTRDDRTEANTLVTPQDGIRFYAGAPLVTAEGLVIGMLCIIDTRPRPAGLTEAQQRGLAALARQTMTLIEMRRSLHYRDSDAGKASVEQSDDDHRDLVESATRARNAQAAGRIGTFEMDVATGAMMVSEEFCRLLGLAIAQGYHSSVAEALVLPEDNVLQSNRISRAAGTASLDVEYRIRRANDGAVRWIARRASFERGADGIVRRMFGTVHDVTERRLANERMAALLELGDRLRSAQSREDIAAVATELLGRTLDAARAGYAVIDAAARHMSIASDWTDGSVASITGTYPWEPFAATMERLSGGRTLAVRDVTADPELANDREAFAAIGVVSQIQVPLIVRDVLVGVLFVQTRAPREWNALELAFAEGVADRTHAAISQLQAESDQKLLNHELGHRLKNMLAMIMAIAVQTLKKVPERAPIEAFERRLMALGSAHDILLQSSWSSARISAIVDGAVDLLGLPHRVNVEGANLTLGPRAALGLTLILHELGTNALKYGALSAEGGHVAISWHIERNDTEPALIVSWRETGGPPAERPDGKGFGSRLISLGILGTGGVATHYSSEGFSAEFTTPLRLVQSA